MSTTLFGTASFDYFYRSIVNLAERLGNDTELLLRNNDALAASLRVAIPAKVVSFDATKQTIVAQPLIREKVVYRDSGDTEFVTLPQLLDVPVIFPQAGNFALTFPIQSDDEVLIVFADMCIDSWWASGDVQNWNDRRRHDLSDGIAIAGLNSVPNVIPSIADDAMEMRTKEAGAKVRVEDAAVEVQGQNHITLETPTYTFPSTVLMPVGTVLDYAGSTAPAGWLLCDGSAVSRTTYAELFDLISTTYGPGNGTTTFNLPDLRGRVSIGKDNMGGTAASRITSASTNGANSTTLGGVGGSETHTLSVDELPAHTHTQSGEDALFHLSTGSANVLSQTSTDSQTESTGGDDPHSNTQPWMALNKIIFANIS